MGKRARVLEIISPTLGRVHNDVRTRIDRRAQAEGRDAKLYLGFNQKEYGTSIYATATSAVLGAPVNGIFESKYAGGNAAQVFTHTSVYKYSSTADTFIVDGQTFTGTYEDYWSGVMHDDNFIYTNGVDPIQVKAAVDGTGTVMASSVAVASYKAYALASFKDHLCLYRTNEAGSEYYKRVRWSVKGALTLSGTADFGSGTAGALDIQDAEGELKTAVQFGASVVVFAERSIHVQYWVGGTEVFRFQKVVSNIGTPSRRGAIAHKDTVYFISKESFYAFRGGDSLDDIGEPIRAFAFGEVNREYLKNSFVEIDDRYDEVRFHVPVSSDTKPSVVWVYSIKGKSWSRQVRPYTAKGESTRVTGTTIGDLQGSIGGLAFTYGDFYLEENATIQLLGDTSGRVVKRDPTTYALSISGTNTPQQFIYETPSLVGERAKRSNMDPYDRDPVDYTATVKRWLKCRVEATGQGTLNVAYSTDGGTTFLNFPESPITLSVAGTTHVLDLDVAGRTVDIQCSNTATHDRAAISYVQLEFLPVGSNEGL